jgi:hypothetical protein
MILLGIHTSSAQDSPGKAGILQTEPIEAGPQRGGRELEIWTSGGHALNGITSGIGLWEAGVRYGWLLTGAHGPGFARGRLEYAVDAVPILWVFQPAITTFGVGLNPLALKWNFQTRGRVVPYFELGGGTVFTSSQVPTGTSHVNFTTGGALGMHILREKYNWSAEVRFMHLSNGSLLPANPGINTLQLRLGVGRFTRAHKN